MKIIQNDNRVGEKPKHSKTQQNNCGTRQKLWWKKTKQNLSQTKTKEQKKTDL